ncbi:MAG: NADH-quinone oxidoreductase subunit N [Nocardioidaceae bacterium]
MADAVERAGAAVGGDAVTQAIDWLVIAPALCLVGGALLALLGDTFAPAARRWLPTTCSIVAVAAGLAFTSELAGSHRSAFCLASAGGSGGPPSCSWVVDNTTVVWWVIMLAAVGLVVLMVQPAAASGEMPAGELHFLLLSSATGALVVAASGDLITLLVAMEAVSLPAFALVGLRRRDRRGAEAALKFFIASVVATAFSLLGISMVYGATGSVVASRVSGVLANGTAVTPVAGVGMMLTVVALGFKTAAVPFQVWVPDTYVGAPIPIAAYLSVVSKAAGLAGLVIVFVRFFPAYFDTWSTVLAVAAALTMTVGNLAALRQQHAVRLLAWSSVAQAGYLLVPLAAGGSRTDLGALQSYAAMYVIVNVCAFAVVLLAAGHGAVRVGDFAGMMRRHPWPAAALGFALLCLAGLPPGVIGLVAKVVIFQSAVDGNLTWLAVVMAVNVAIGLVYYLRFLVTVIRPGGDEGTEFAGGARPSGAGSQTNTGRPWAVELVVGATLAAAVVLSVFPGPLFNGPFR